MGEILVGKGKLKMAGESRVLAKVDRGVSSLVLAYTLIGNRSPQTIDDPLLPTQPRRALSSKWFRFVL